MAQSRRQVRPRSSNLDRSASFCARNPNKASMTLMLAAASIKVMDALFGFLAQNDAERSRLELLGRTWRRDWAMRQFHRFSGIPEKNGKSGILEKNQIIRKLSGIGCSGRGVKRRDWGVVVIL